MLNYDLFDEDRDKFYETTLFSDIDDCDYCPFRENGEEDEYCDHSGNPDRFHPCEFMNSKYKGMTVQEVINEMVDKRIAYENYLDRKFEKEQQLKEKKEKAAAKRMQTNWENRDLNYELKRINKAIKARKSLLSYITSWSNAVAFADNMMYHKPIPEKKDKHPLEIEIEQLEKRIEEIKTEKKERAKLRRKSK